MKLKLIITFQIVLTSFGIASFGQVVTEKETFEDAEFFFAQEDYTEALSTYTRLYKRGFKENANINYRIGICYLNSTIDRTKAVPYLETAVTKITPKYDEGSFKETNAPYDAYLYLANAYRINMQMDKSIEAYTKYMSLISKEKGRDIEIQWCNTQIDACNRAKTATNTPARVRITPLGKPINNNQPNFNPAIAADENSIVYVSKQKFYQAVFYSRKKKDKWESPRNITPDIMSDGDQFPVFLSSDGRTLLLNKVDGSNSDIYISDYDGKQWSISVPLNKEVNSKYWESHACMSADGKTLIFISNRKESLGGTDIFKSELIKEDQWGPAQNLGPTINTTLNEETPFLSADGKTLYFSSQGHNAIGGYDVFYSNKDALDKWTEPVNLGFPINTTDDDLFYVPTKDKHIAYQAKSVKNGMGDLDIVKIETFAEDHPYTFFIKGNLKELLPGCNPEDFLVTLVDQHSQKSLDSTRKISDGVFMFVHLPGIYQIKVSSADFKTTSDYFIVPENYPAETFTLTSDILNIGSTYTEYVALKAKEEKAAKEGVKQLELAKAEARKKALKKMVKPSYIHNLLFSFGESILTFDAQNEVDTILKLMKQNQSLELEVIGYADAQGSEAYNLKLSENRARSVFDRLVSAGVPTNRLKILGKGEDNAIAVNENPDGSDNPIGRAFNRRVEFRIIKCDNKNILVDPVKVPRELKPANNKG